MEVKENKMLLPLENVIVYNISTSISPLSSRNIDIKPSSTTSQRNPQSLGWNARLVPLTESNICTQDPIIVNKTIDSLASNVELDEEIINKQNTSQCNRQNFQQSIQVENTQISDECNIEESKLDSSSCDHSEYSVPTLPLTIIERFTSDTMLNSQQYGWTEDEINRKVYEEIIRIHERSSISDEDGSKMIQAALEVNSAKAARLFIDEEPYKDLSHVESSFITGDKNLVTFRPSEFQSIIKISKSKPKKSNQGKTTLKPVKSKSKMKRHITTEDKQGESINDLKLLKAVEEIERTRNRMMLRASAALSSNKAMKNRHRTLAEACKILESDIKSKLQSSIVQSQIDSARSGKTSTFSDFFTEYPTNHPISSIQSSQTIQDCNENNNREVFNSNQDNYFQNTFTGLKNSPSSYRRFSSDICFSPLAGSMSRRQISSSTDYDLCSESIAVDSDCALQLNRYSKAQKSAVSIMSSPVDGIPTHTQLQKLIGVPLADWRKIGRNFSSSVFGEDATNYSSCYSSDDDCGDDKSHMDFDFEDDASIDAIESLQTMHDRATLGDLYSKLQKFESVYSETENSHCMETKEESSSLWRTELPQINPPNTKKKGILAVSSSLGDSFQTEKKLSVGSLPPISGINAQSNVQEKYAKEESGLDVMNMRQVKALFAAADAGDAVGKLISNMIKKNINANTKTLVGGI